MNNEAELLPGTLDLLILKAVSLGPLHGYGVLMRIQQISGEALFIEQGALYPALFRLVRQGLLKTEWDRSENNRRAKYYELTAKGRKRLREETDWWNRSSKAIAAGLSARLQETGGKRQATSDEQGKISGGTRDRRRRTGKNRKNEVHSFLAVG